MSTFVLVHGGGHGSASARTSCILASTSTSTSATSSPCCIATTCTTSSSSATSCTSTLATRDREQMTQARAAGRLWEIDTGHDLMITEPRAVADALRRIAAA